MLVETPAPRLTKVPTKNKIFNEFETFHFPFKGAITKELF